MNSVRVWILIMLILQNLIDLSYSIKYSGKKLRVTIVPDFGPVNPNAPGWFALKSNSQYGKSIGLGHLLKNNKKHQDVELDYEESNSIEQGGIEMSPIIKNYDRACLWSEYLEAKASSSSAPSPSIETNFMIEAQNHQLAVFFVNSISQKDFPSLDNPLLKQFPRTGLQLLDLSKKIFFSKICKDLEYKEDESYDPWKDRLAPQDFVDNVYLLFLKLYNITRPSWNDDEYLEESEFDWIKSNLENCEQAPDGVSQNKIKWFTDECKETVVAFDEYNNYACTPYVEFDFNVKKYDPILDFVWHIVTSVHTHCFESFQSNIRMWHKYALAMMELITEDMQQRWSASSEKYEKFYKRVFGPFYQNYFDNMNRCMNACASKSNVPYLIPRLNGVKNTRYAPMKSQKFHD